MTGRYVWTESPDGSSTAVWVEGDAKVVTIPPPKRPPGPLAPDPDALKGWDLTQPKGKSPQHTALTPNLLHKLSWHRVDVLAPALAAGCKTFGITTPSRLADFLGQVGHESGRGKWLAEIWGPTAAQLRYEGRKDLGNTQPGDGSRFRGRGLIQITGRANYEAAAKAHAMDLAEFTKWMETPEGAALSACWWWAKHGCNELSDAGDFRALTRRINGGLNGYEERVKLRDAARKALAG